jgi:4-hydroxy 2-oxovalerate aldolase
VSARPAPAVTLLDCTLRDGGYVNGHDFSLAAGRDLVSHLGRSGVDYVEIGYVRRGPGASARGLAGHCPEPYIEALAEVRGTAGLAVMAHPADLSLADLPRLRACGVGLVRIPLALERLAAALPYVEAARACGLEVALNVIRISELERGRLLDALRAPARWGVTVLYLADSNGALAPSAVDALVEDAAAALGVPLGFHAHDNLGLGLSNALTALGAGASWIDGTLGGIGKGAGNARLELLAIHLQQRGGRRFDHRALAAAARNVQAYNHPRFLELYGGALAGALDFNLEQLAGVTPGGAADPAALLAALQQRLEERDLAPLGGPL